VFLWRACSGRMLRDWLMTTTMSARANELVTLVFDYEDKA
jgi:hypothetical protein